MNVDSERLVYEAGELELLAVHIESADPDIAKYINWLERRHDDLAREVKHAWAHANAVARAADGHKAEAERLRDELAVRLRDLAICHGRHECGQRHPGRAMLRDHARRVASREGWPDPYPEVEAPEGVQE